MKEPARCEMCGGRVDEQYSDLPNICVRCYDAEIFRFFVYWGADLVDLIKSKPTRSDIIDEIQKKQPNVITWATMSFLVRQVKPKLKKHQASVMQLMKVLDRLAREEKEECNLELGNSLLLPTSKKS